MIHKRFILSALLLALTLVLVPACGDEEEPVAPDAGQDKPVVADAGDPGAEPPAPPKLWKFDGDSLAGYIAAVKDLKENAPKALRDATESAITMAKSSDGLSFGNKATAILEKHGLTQAQFNKFGTRLWAAVVAVAPEKGAEVAGGLGALGGEHAATVKGIADAALKDITKDVTEEDKTVVKENLDEILGLLK